jgi:hypothetical protein
MAVEPEQSGELVNRRRALRLEAAAGDLATCPSIEETELDRALGILEGCIGKVG